MSLTIETDAVQAVLTASVVGGNGYGISHSWDGTVLTVRSDSGSSSADLVGPRGPAGAEQLMVTVTQGDDGYTADKSFGEIGAAVERGELPAVKLVGAAGESYGHLVSYKAGTMAQFSAWVQSGTLDGSTVMTVYADDRVSVSYPADPIAESVRVVKSDSTVTVTVGYTDLSSAVTTITLDENGDPISVSDGLNTCSITWEGFDE